MPTLNLSSKYIDIFEYLKLKEKTKFYFNKIAVLQIKFEKKLLVSSTISVILVFISYLLYYLSVISVLCVLFSDL